jgi:hypothetical protein
MGLVLMMLNFGYLFYLKSKKNSVFLKVLGLLALWLFIPILISNFNDKVDGENTSGLIRLRDFQIGVELIKEKPLLGHGFFSSDYIKTKSYSGRIESNLLYDSFIQLQGEMAGGYTNGLFFLIAVVGIPISIIIVFFHFKNKFVQGSNLEIILFGLLPLITMFSEPISITSFFFMFPLSYLILGKSLRDKEKNNMRLSSKLIINKKLNNSK